MKPVKLTRPKRKRGLKMPKEKHTSILDEMPPDYYKEKYPTRKAAADRIAELADLTKPGDALWYFLRSLEFKAGLDVLDEAITETREHMKTDRKGLEDAS